MGITDYSTTAHDARPRKRRDEGLARVIPIAKAKPKPALTPPTLPPPAIAVPPPPTEPEPVPDPVPSIAPPLASAAAAEAPLESSSAPVKRKAGRVKKFERVGSKYVCEVCNQKFFTKNEVEACFEAHPD